MANVAYPFRITDNSNNLVAGATIVIGSMTLVAGTLAHVPAVGLGTGASLNSGGTPAGIAVTYYDFGTGDYSLVTDPEAFGEAYIALAVSKVGSAITGSNALKPILATKDSSRIILALPNIAIGAAGGIPVGDSSGRVVLEPSEHTLIADTDVPSAITAADLPAGVVSAMLAAVINSHKLEDIWASDAAINLGTISTITANTNAKTVTIAYTDGAVTATYVAQYSDSGLTNQTGRTVTITGLP